MGLWDIGRSASNWFFKLSPYYKEYIALKSEFESLKRERDALKKELDFRNGLIFENGLYWHRANLDDPGPYCQVCVDKKTARSHLQGSDREGWDCKICNTHFPTATSKQTEIDELNRRFSNPDGYI